MFELILAGFLSFGLPPATTPVKACTNWSKRVGCATNSGGGRESSVQDARDRNKAARGEAGGGRGNARAK